MFLWAEPWEAQYFFKYKDEIYIPLDDCTAYPLYPKYNWIYNKLKICEIQNIKAYPHGVYPTEFPVFSKPIYNLAGMSHGTRIYHDYQQWEADYFPGHFWMPFLEGTQYTTDFAVLKGETKWNYTFTVKEKDESFIKWISCNLPEKFLNYTKNFIKENFPNYTGIINIENIEETMIECHLRMSPQYVDLYGENWLDSVVSLYKYGIWKYDNTKKPGVSRILRVKKDIRPYITNWDKFNKLRSKVSSIQLTWQPAKYLSFTVDDDKSYRVAVVNAQNEEVAEEVMWELAKIIGELGDLENPSQKINLSDLVVG